MLAACLNRYTYALNSIGDDRHQRSGVGADEANKGCRGEREKDRKRVREKARHRKRVKQYEKESQSKRESKDGGRGSPSIHYVLQLVVYGIWRMITP